MIERVRIHEPGAPCDKFTGVVVERVETGVKVRLDELPPGWKWPEAWFGVNQVVPAK